MKVKGFVGVQAFKGEKPFVASYFCGYYKRNVWESIQGVHTDEVSIAELRKRGWRVLPCTIEVDETKHPNVKARNK